ncbi:DNA-binding transcriptional regulator, MarR family [Jatrophihabitans endophyticus]|uniref:DNA-binding transcriptional regulator, MarR family n=1 Tax=Jatrophihabitans endophyticus TaxID=1206085 RepID=A0A1M5T4X5_9ACTN|nr:MarR family transcriptional regulator [Jatrophihabitans endophyticus]SHH45799.1 DNA-binding transcriptional regulator, MarR family [Jatrophihabitans endophyticus]
MTRRTPWAEYERAVRVYTDAGAAETVQRIVTAMSRLERRLDLFYSERFDAIDISRTEWPVLQALAMEGRRGGSHPSRLADAAGVTASTMTHRLDRMVERGLVERSPDPENRTRTVVSLTRDGWELFRRAVLDVESDEAGVFAPLTDAERTTLAGLLEKALAGQDTDHHHRRRPR